MPTRRDAGPLRRRAAPELLSAGAFLVAAILLFGASWPVVRLAMLEGGASPAWLAASRSCLAFLALGLLALAQPRKALPGRADLPSLLAVGILQLTVFFALCHVATRYLPAGSTAVLSNAAIIWVVPLSALLGTRVAPDRWLAAAAALAGVVLFVQPWRTGWGSEAALGYALLLLAALAWAATIMVTRRWPPALHPLQMLPWAFCLSAFLLLGLALLLEPGGGLPARAWPHALFNGLVVAPLGTWCLVELARRMSPVLTSIALLIIPAVGVFVSALVLDEAVTPNVLLGAALILLGTGVAARPAPVAAHAPR